MASFKLVLFSKKRKQHRIQILVLLCFFSKHAQRTTDIRLDESWSPQNHSYPEKMFPSNVLISLEAEKNPLSLIENPHKSPFRKFFYDHSKVELFSFLCSNFYKKILSITRQRKDATAVAQLTLILNARVSYHKCHTHNKLDAFWYRFTKQVLKFIRCSVCLANWYRSKDTVNIRWQWQVRSFVFACFLQERIYD